jgi:hypothetical protein
MELFKMLLRRILVFPVMSLTVWIIGWPLICLLEDAKAATHFAKGISLDVWYGFANSRS